ncbi:LOW QUALITY PROTEIN: hypothetical protein PHMEG_00013728 [Phytophthora megakarya]|uniref:CCHC-type domain-containing protein n=1 Tax=Phytophthora megakarya TaxID=4795 RepID=A0A225W778_9STRA|nr:LOW QUALITY PROTEIN: hypothetical protein PHMEG_00013728 [Phytophthora megakarya]
MVETFDNLDDYSQADCKEERMNQAKAVADARAQRPTHAESGPQQQQPHGENAFLAQGSKKRRSGGAGATNETKRRRTKIQCWNCGKWGHYERECTAAKKENNSKKGKKAKGKPAAKEGHEDTHEDVPGFITPTKKKQNASQCT